MIAGRSPARTFRSRMAYPWIRLPGFRDVDALDNRDPAWIRAVDRVLHPMMWRWFSPEVRGLDRIPEGPALYVGNHSGGFVTPDTWIFASAVMNERGIEHVPYGLAHQVIMGAPFVNNVLARLGGIEAKPENAHRVFEHGGKVLAYPGGDLDAFRPSHERYRVVFGPRRGYLRLALVDGVPIVPVVSAGGHDGWIVITDGRALAKRLRTHRVLRTDVLPITFSIPWGLSIGAPPYVPWPTKILIQVLEPICFDRRGEEAANDGDYVERCHREVFTRMQAALDELARERQDHRRPFVDRLKWRRSQ